MHDSTKKQCWGMDELRLPAESFAQITQQIVW